MQSSCEFLKPLRIGWDDRNQLGSTLFEGFAWFPFPCKFSVDSDSSIEVGAVIEHGVDFLECEGMVVEIGSWV